MELLITSVLIVLVTTIIVGYILFSNKIKKMSQEQIKNINEVDRLRQELSKSEEYKQSSDEKINTISREYNNLSQELNKLKQEKETMSKTNTTNVFNENILVNQNKQITNTETYNLNIGSLLSFLSRNIEEEGKKDAVKLQDRSQIEVKHKQIYQEIMDLITRVKISYKNKIEDHIFEEELHIKVGTEDTANRIGSSKKKLLENLKEVEKIEDEIKNNTNHQYKKLILSYEKGFKETLASISCMQLGIQKAENNNNDINNYGKI